MLGATVNFKMISEEINLILSGLYGLYTSEGRPTKRGGLRFLDIKSNKTFGFEKTRETDSGNLLILSAPYNFPIEDLKLKEKLEKEIKKGPYSNMIFEFWLRPSRDKGKEDRNFVELKYLIHTGEILSDANIFNYAKQHAIGNSKLIVKNILLENVAPLAKATMDHLIETIRNFKK